jgi:hypothetical protein
VRTTETRDSWRAFDEALDSLPAYDASSERIERIRAHCLAALSVRRNMSQTHPLRRPLWREWLAPAFALGLSAFYLAAAVGTALQLAEVIRAIRALAR